MSNFKLEKIKHDECSQEYKDDVGRIQIRVDPSSLSGQEILSESDDYDPILHYLENRKEKLKNEIEVFLAKRNRLDDHINIKQNEMEAMDSSILNRKQELNETIKEESNICVTSV